jgi:glutaredoxin
VKILIEIFVRSSSPYIDVEYYREMSQHVICAPDLARWGAEIPAKFKGRILPEKDRTVLEYALRVANETGEKVLVFDISRVSDRLKAIKRGVKRTPTIIINGKKYDSVDDIQRFLQALPNRH